MRCYRVRMLHRNTRNFSTKRSHRESKDRYGLPLTYVRNMTQRNLSKVLWPSWVIWLMLPKWRERGTSARNGKVKNGNKTENWKWSHCMIGPRFRLGFFLSHSNHSHTDMQLIPLEKIRSSRDSVRKARESHLIDKAMTLEPHGLNRRDEVL